MPLSPLPDAAVDQKIHARDGSDVVTLEGFEVTIGHGSTQKIVVESFDHKATPTLTTALTISGHPTAYTIKPSNTPIAAATITGFSATVACYPTINSIAGSQYTNCVEDTVTTFGAKDRTGMTVGSFTVTPNPTGFAVGKQTLTPGGTAVQGTHTF